MRIAFLGTSEFAVPVLESLRTSEQEVCLVVAAPDRAKGRGRKVESSPVARWAAELDLPLHQPDSINSPSAIDRLRKSGAEIIVVVAYGQILGKSVLGLPEKGVVNLHGSILPTWRGPAPIARAIQAGDEVTGITLQYVVSKVDAGDIIDCTETDIAASDTAATLSERLSLLAADLLLKNLTALDEGTAERTVQEESKATYAKALEKKEGLVPWHQTAEQINNHVRAMALWPGAYTRLPMERGAQRVQIRKVEVLNTGPPKEFPGTVLMADGRLEIAAGFGTIRVLSLIRSGRKETDAASFLRGVSVKAGGRAE